jgi:DNA polymerase III subunit epsilon
MTVDDIPFAAVDFESAGVRPGGTDVPVQIGIAVMQGGRFGETFTSFLGTDQPVTWSAQKVHGIRTEDLAGAPRLPELWPRVRALLGNRWVVAHGAATEKRFLRAYPFHGFGPWVDTLKVVRAVWPDLPSFALGEVIKALGLEAETRALHEGFRWHDALSDALASLVLLRQAVAECALADSPAEVLLHPDDSAYHRAKARRAG